MPMYLYITLDILLTSAILFGYARFSATILSPRSREDAYRRAELLLRLKPHRGYMYPLAVALVGASACCVLSFNLLFAGIAILVLGLYSIKRVHRLSNLITV